jgi:hypothetical protein
MVALELVTRFLDGYALLSFQLRVSATAVRPSAATPDQTHLKRIQSAAAEKAVQAIPLAPGMSHDWFQLSPPPLERREVPAALATAFDIYGKANLALEGIHVYNSRLVQEAACNNPFFRDFPRFAFLFDPLRPTTFPRYRFPRDTSLPTGLVTNNFGWRGKHIEFRKPSDVIRLGFAGASTTVSDHGSPFSYPELAGFWLNKWLEASGSTVRVEVMNAGREGMNSSDIAAIIQDELAPMEPDIVVYYEGSNQFRLEPLMRPGTSGPRIASYSALARRVEQLLPIQALPEPERQYELAWPATVNEADPPLDSDMLPVSLPRILGDLDQARAALAPYNAELAISSFVWTVYEGIKFDPVRHRSISDYLNQSFPFRYRDMERLAQFQNRVFAKYAAAHGLPFLNIAARVPRDPDLFGDAIHANYQGVRVHAWAAAQELAILLRDRMQSGKLPRPAQSTLASHPGFAGPERTVTLTCRDQKTDVRDFSVGLKVPPLQ